jgi:NitT/TauT family transport system permease protein
MKSDSRADVRHFPAWLRRLVTPAALLALWIGLTVSGFINPVFLPGPFATLKSFLGLLSQDFLAQQLAPSVFRVMSAFLLSASVAVPLGVLGAQFPVVADLVEPVCGFMRYLPVAALVPLCILWFGIDDTQKISVIVLGVAFQLVLLIASSAGSTPAELIEAARTFGLSKFQIVKRVVLPWSLPAIWDDLRIAAGWAWSYLVLAELVAGNRGVGYFIVQSQRYLQTDRVFAGIIFIGILGALTDWLFRWSGSRLFGWADVE